MIDSIRDQLKYLFLYCKTVLFFPCLYYYFYVASSCRVLFSDLDNYESSYMARESL